MPEIRFSNTDLAHYPEDNGVRAVLISGAIVITGGVLFLILWSSAEVIKLTIDIEANTRRAAELLDRVARNQ